MSDISLLQNSMISSIPSKGEVTLRQQAKGTSGEANFEAQLQNSLKSQEKKPIDKKLMDACVEMESLFVSKMLKEMRNTVHKNGFINGGFGEEVFEDMLYDEYALNVSKNSKLGLATMLYDEMSRK